MRPPSRARPSPTGERHRVVIVGGGFAGLQAARRLRRSPVDVTLVDRRNFHLFQPLSYQVATGELSPSEIAFPLRGLLASAPNVRVLLGEVCGFDLIGRRVRLAPADDGTPSTELAYDTLIVAAGSSYTYFGHDEWRATALEVKSLESALQVRARLLSAFERAEQEPDAAAQAAWLTFVVVGGGPTGVEMAGQIAELARDTLRGDFRRIDPATARILLVEAGPRLLATFPESLSASAAAQLGELGVTPRLATTVVGLDADGVDVVPAGEAPQRIAARTVVWAAGVAASPLAAQLARATGAEPDRAGRLTVGADLSVDGHPEVLVLGDMVRVRDAEGHAVALPGVAPVAIQQGAYAARLVADRLRDRPTPAFRFRDKGNVATIGRRRAVADLGAVRLSGAPAWLLWLGIHLAYLAGAETRLIVVLRWTASFVRHGRDARLITR